MIDRFAKGCQDLRDPWHPHLRLTVGLVLLAISSLTVPSLVVAHDGGAFGITIPVERVAPGAALPIIGAEWAARALLDVRIQAAGSDAVTIATIRTDDAGHFAVAVRLPNALPPGMATIQVVSGYGVLASASVTIDPTAPRAQLPTAAGAVVDSVAANGVDPIPLLVLGLAVGALAVLLVRTRHSVRTV